MIRVDTVGPSNQLTESCRFHNGVIKHMVCMVIYVRHTSRDLRDGTKFITPFLVVLKYNRNNANMTIFVDDKIDEHIICQFCG